MKARLRLAATLLLLVSVPAGAHDFWLQPASFRVGPSEPVALTLQVGHGPYRQRSPIPARRIVRFEAIAPDGTAADLRSGLHLGAATDADALLKAPGTHVLALETDNRALTSLPALRFNDYLRAEGLTPALAERERTRRTDRDGAERYARHAKALVRVGAPGAGVIGSQVTRPLGMALEIVPERDPYALPHADRLPVRVLYQGRVLAGALLKLTRLEHDEAPVETHRTDAMGRAVFTVPAQGSWLLNVIWTRPLPDGSDVDFETDFASLAFGYPAAP